VSDDDDDDEGSLNLGGGHLFHGRLDLCLTKHKKLLAGVKIDNFGQGGVLGTVSHSFSFIG